jgi:hypothetical protein
VYVVPEFKPFTAPVSVQLVPVVVPISFPSLYTKYVTSPDPAVHDTFT